MTADELNAEIDLLWDQRRQKEQELAIIDGALQAFTYMLNQLSKPIEEPSSDGI